jgi:hypothetical protein
MSEANGPGSASTSADRPADGGPQGTVPGSGHGDVGAGSGHGDLGAHAGGHDVEAPLGPIDLAAWGAGAAGVVIGLAMAVAFAIATNRLAV